MAKKGSKVGISSKIKSKRMRDVFSKTYDANYAKSTSAQQMTKDIQYLRNTLYRSKTAFTKRGLGDETSKYFDIALKGIKTSKDMSAQEKTEILNSAIKYTRDHRLTVSLFDIQKQSTIDSLENSNFPSVVRQSKDMTGNDSININKLTDQQLYKVFESLGDIRKGLGKFEKGLGIGSGDEFEAAVEVVYSSLYDSSDWKYNDKNDLTENIVNYLKEAKTRIAGKEF